jgi:hypothetical protein
MKEAVLYCKINPAMESNGPGRGTEYPKNYMQLNMFVGEGGI